MTGAAPEAPGLRQYTCQCGINSKRSPSHRVCPGVAWGCSLSSVTVACGVETVAAPWAGGAANARSQASQSMIANSPGFVFIASSILARSARRLSCFSGKHTR